MSSTPTARSRPAATSVRAGVAALAALGVALAVATGPRAGAAQPAPPGVSASTWLLDEAPSGVLSTAGSPDPGLMSDAALAAAAAGDPSGERVVDALDALATEWISPAPGVEFAGSIAKLLVIGDVWDRDPGVFAGGRLRARLVALMRPLPDPQAGRFSNLGTTDNTNVFSQSLSVIALARTGVVPAAAVEFLLAQRCPTGGFRLFLATTPCTNAGAVDPDATAIAVQGLLAAAGRVGEPADATLETRRTQALAGGVTWLETNQRPDGGFALAPPAAVPNANTTGLAAQALRAAGSTGRAEAAADWLAARQLGCSDAAASDDAGAIAYSDAALDAARRSGIQPIARDQFRRATAQAVLAFGAPDLGRIERPEGEPIRSVPCDGTTTTTTSSPATTTTDPPVTASVLGTKLDATERDGRPLAATGASTVGTIWTAGAAIVLGAALRRASRKR